jgi:hypothetical protein
MALRVRRLIGLGLGFRAGLKSGRLPLPGIRHEERCNLWLINRSRHLAVLSKRHRRPFRERLSGPFTFGLGRRIQSPGGAQVVMVNGAINI